MWPIGYDHLWDAEAFYRGGGPCAGASTEGRFFFKCHLSDDGLNIRGLHD